MLKPAATRTRPTRTTYVAGAVAFLAWLPFLWVPLASDAAGFLMLSRQWSPGSSLYGDYWVDRPPLLLWLFRLAGLGPVTLHSDGLLAPGVVVLGALASAATVLLAGLLAARVAPRRSHWTGHLAPVLAAALLASPLLGMPETNGEVLAVPFVLVGVLGLVTALTGPASRRALLVAGGAGVAAACAALIKQNVIDVFVLAAVLLPLSRDRVPHLLRRTAAFAAGALGTLTLVVGTAAALGTAPTQLWDAVVTFRLEAAAVIGSSASPATSQRFVAVLMAFLASGAALTLLVTGFLAARTAWRRGPRSAPLRVAALAMVAWELFGVAGGGSYWLHYLTGLIPGVVLLASLVRPAGWRRVALAGCLALTVLGTLTAWSHELAVPVDDAIGRDARVADYLRAHAAPGDGAVVAFGRPDIVAAAGLDSPYPYLWSLPVRVRDPHLRELQAVLTGPDAPQWVVVTGDGLTSWGITPAPELTTYFDHHYREQASFGDLHVWSRR
ncbi:hypothetical protein [Nocardioides nitrophenolicus]|uniref:hypothetical protein n=1 Tax=Nocardioides nitrophenolicus TaxID=60489 RepID=UPI0027DC1264|nr:hypothetical protein [Nocardioides nitrophenolicus]MBM7517257.1 hypothetical protein [Nocardioides nitrophenolicus]